MALVDLYNIKSVNKNLNKLKILFGQNQSIILIERRQLSDPILLHLPGFNLNCSEGNFNRNCSVLIYVKTNYHFERKYTFVKGGYGTFYGNLLFSEIQEGIYLHDY